MAECYKRQDLLTDLFQAYYEARKKKRNTASQLAFEIDLEHNLMELYEQIRDRNSLLHLGYVSWLTGQ
ncbi:hypothetical protein DWY70_00905 [Bacteroides fragilis]|nr:hypothetical protein DWY70_00905 [Bacteroides fragilis]